MEATSFNRRYNQDVMKTDVEIAQKFTAKPIQEIAEKLGVTHEELQTYGKEIGKIDIATLSRPRAQANKPKLILVSAITPTPAGEGKTTTTIGLGQAFTQLNESVGMINSEF